MPGATRVAREREEKGWAVESVFLAKLFELLGCCLFTEDSYRWITGNELNQYRYKRDHGPDNQQQDRDPSQGAQNFVL